MPWCHSEINYFFLNLWREKRFIFRNKFKIMFAFRQILARSRLHQHRLYSSSNPQREFQRYQEQARRKNLTGILYVGSFVISFLGISYAAVPLYRLLCKRTGFMGTPKTEPTVRDPQSLKPLQGHRKLHIHFSGQVSTKLDWSFKPEQRQVSVVPGETALAFFKAYNKSDKPIVGIATYNVVPEQAAPYFNKIQCFCFDEQQLDPQEDIDMPVFFFIDPEFANDPLMDDIDDITLSYTFFKASGR